MDAIVSFLSPYYFYILFVHVVAVMVWIWSTSVAYAFFVVPVFKAWRRSPDDPGLIELRNWVMERFDHGVIYEHLAFPVILLTGPLLYVVGGHSTVEGWLLLKLLIVVGVFLPIEICDYYLSHLGGNKHRVRSTQDPEAYERAVQRHWLFFLVTSAPVMIGSMAVVFLAITKPF
ncbi:MAG: hypothetical protein WBQ17_06335 [Rhizomicrobium sp.]